MTRCGNCMSAHRDHRARREAAPLCPDGKGSYREATAEELDAGYRAAFPDGPQPIASFKLDDPDDVARAKAILSPAALNRFFGEGGGGMTGFAAALVGAAAEQEKRA